MITPPDVCPTTAENPQSYFLVEAHYESPFRIVSHDETIEAESIVLGGRSIERSRKGEDLQVIAYTFPTRVAAETFMKNVQDSSYIDLKQWIVSYWSRSETVEIQYVYVLHPQHVLIRLEPLSDDEAAERRSQKLDAPRDTDDDDDDDDDYEG